MTTSRKPFGTLGTLRNRLKVRIGAMAGASFATPILDDFLIQAQAELYNLIDWQHLKAAKEIATVPGHEWYDLPPEVPLEKILEVSVWYGSRYITLRKGIDLIHRINRSTVPVRYEIQWRNAAPDGTWKVQIELNPTPNLATQVRFDYRREPLRFTEDDDVASIPTEPIFLHALTHAKLHFRQPDGPAYQKRLEDMILQLKGEHRRRRVVAPNQSHMLPEDVSYLLPPQS